MFNLLPSAAAVVPSKQPCHSTVRPPELSSSHPLLPVNPFEMPLVPYNSLAREKDPFGGEKAVY